MVSSRHLRASSRIGRMLAFCGLLCGVSLGRPPPERAEVQRHGYAFEKWVRDTFFGGYEPKGYTQLWDIPAEANTRHGGIPVNPKAVKYGSSIDLGDALRQFDIAQSDAPFLLIVGFWEQVTAGHKRMVNVQAVKVRPKAYQQLWDPITRGDLERLMTAIKARPQSIEEARKQAAELKRQPPYSRAVIQLNPKIDGHQRRLQCSLRFDDFFKYLAPASDRNRQAMPVLFGVVVPSMWASPPRGGQHLRGARQTQ